MQPLPSKSHMYMCPPKALKTALQNGLKRENALQILQKGQLALLNALFGTYIPCPKIILDAPLHSGAFQSSRIQNFLQPW